MIQRFHMAAQSRKELLCYQSEECLAPRAARQHNNNKCPLTPPHLQLPCERFSTTKLGGGLFEEGRNSMQSSRIEHQWLPLPDIKLQQQMRLLMEPTCEQ